MRGHPGIVNTTGAGGAAATLGPARSATAVTMVFSIPAAVAVPGADRAVRS
jgi:hypothetical protein